MTTTTTASYNTEEARAEDHDRYPSVLDLLQNEQWVGSDSDILNAIKLLSDVLIARDDVAE